MLLFVSSAASFLGRSSTDDPTALAKFSAYLSNADVIVFDTSSPMYGTPKYSHSVSSNPLSASSITPRPLALRFAELEEGTRALLCFCCVLDL